MEPKQQIQQFIQTTLGWKGEKLNELHSLIIEAAPNITEDWKWDVPVFTHKGMVCAISSFKDHVKINFFQGANLPANLHKHFNSGLDSKSHRSIDFFENDQVNAEVIKQLVSAAMSFNEMNKKK